MAVSDFVIERHEVRSWAGTGLIWRPAQVRDPGFQRLAQSSRAQVDRRRTFLLARAAQAQAPESARQRRPDRRTAAGQPRRAVRSAGLGVRQARAVVGLIFGGLDHVVQPQSWVVAEVVNWSAGFFASWLVVTEMLPANRGQPVTGTLGPSFRSRHGRPSTKSDGVCVEPGVPAWVRITEVHDAGQPRTTSGSASSGAGPPVQGVAATIPEGVQPWTPLEGRPSHRQPLAAQPRLAGVSQTLPHSRPAVQIASPPVRPPGGWVCRR